MFKKIIFSLILLTFSLALAMEEKSSYQRLSKYDKGKEKLRCIPQDQDETEDGVLQHRSLSDETTSSIESELRINLNKLLKRSSMGEMPSSWHNTASSMEKVLDKFNVGGRGPRRKSDQIYQIPLQSPRSSDNTTCPLLKFPDEVLLMIIYQLININIEEPKPDQSEDFIDSVKVYKIIAPLMLSCHTIANLIPEAICTFYLIKLDHYLRPQKIQWAQSSYDSNDLKTVKYLLTSMLREAQSERLLDNHYFLEKLLSQKSISFKNNLMSFELTDDENENLRLLTDILLTFASLNDDFLTLNTIFGIVLSNPYNKKILNYLVSLNGVVPNDDLSDSSNEYEKEKESEAYNDFKLIDSHKPLINRYMSTQLMRSAFDGTTKAIEDANLQNPDELFVSTRYGFNAIVWAIIGENYELLDSIFANIGIDHLTSPINFNQNLIHFATLYASAEALEYLLLKLKLYQSHEEMIDVENNDEQSPLCLAINNGFEEKVLVLLKHGASVELLKPSKLSNVADKPEMLKELIESQEYLHKLSRELKNEGADKLTRDAIIKCCIKARKVKTRLLHSMIFGAASVASLLLYAIEKL